MADHIQIGDISPRIQFVGNGVQDTFTYPFPIFVDADLEVYEDDTLKSLSTDYTVAEAGVSSGGTVTFVTPPANAVTVTLRRNKAIERTSDFQESGEFRAKVINDDLDILTATLQQVETEQDRSMKLDPTDTATSMTLPLKAERASRFAAYDADGDPIAAAGTSADLTPVSAFINGLLDDGDAATARATLGLGTFAVENTAAVPAQTLAGKMSCADNELERPRLTDYAESVNVIGATGGGAQDIDLALGNVVTLTVDTSANTFTFSNPSASGMGCSFTLIITNGGSQSVGWPASVDWAGGTPPNLTVAGVDVLTFVTVDGGTLWYGFFAGLDMK
jgi:hypothetical protein